MSPDVRSCLDLWGAALELFIDDGVDFATRGPDTAGVRMAAHNDLVECGPMTRRLAKFCLVDPEMIQSAFKAKADRAKMRAA